MVTGKGGVGKTTISAALGLLGARRGLRTIVVEVGDHGRMPDLFEATERAPGTEARLREDLYAMTIDPDRVLLEWVQELGGRVPGRILAGSGTFQYFAAAAPGAKELFAMVKIWELSQDKRWQRRAKGYDLVVLDAPATGHALGMLHSPSTFGAIARVGPVAGQAERVGAMLRDPARSAYVGVAIATDMAVTETIELQDRLQEQIGRDLDAVIVNSLLPRRFSTEELQRIEALDGAVPAAGRQKAARGRPGAGRSARGEHARRTSAAELREAAVQAARAVHERSRFQHNQIARLRRRGFEVTPVPFVWRPRVDLEALEGIADLLERRLEGLPAEIR